MYDEGYELLKFSNNKKNPMRAKSLQWSPALRDPMDYNPQCSSVHGILQAKILEWAAMSSSMEPFQPMGLNPGLPHGRQMLYPLSHWGILDNFFGQISQSLWQRLDDKIFVFSNHIWFTKMMYHQNNGEHLLIIYYKTALV